MHYLEFRDEQEKRIKKLEAELALARKVVEAARKYLDADFEQPAKQQLLDAIAAYDEAKEKRG